MQIEIDTVLGILTFDDVEISMELLSALTTDDDSYFQIKRKGNEVMVHRILNERQQ